LTIPIECNVAVNTVCELPVHCDTENAAEVLLISIDSVQKA